MDEMTVELLSNSVQKEQKQKHFSRLCFCGEMVTLESMLLKGGQSMFQT